MKEGMIICSRPAPGYHPCSFCKKIGKALLCDFPLNSTKTCDAKCCPGCAEHVGPNLDYCPIHKRKPTPTERAAEGIKRAVDHADAEQSAPKWSELAEAYAREIIAKLDHSPFLFEVIVATSKHDGEPQPPDPRAWGHIARRLARAGVIRKVGYSQEHTNNASPKPLWCKTEGVI